MNVVQRVDDIFACDVLLLRTEGGEDHIWPTVSIWGVATEFGAARRQKKEIRTSRAWNAGDVEGERFSDLGMVGILRWVGGEKVEIGEGPRLDLRRASCPHRQTVVVG